MNAETSLPAQQLNPSHETITSPKTIGSGDHFNLAEQWAKQTEESVLGCSSRINLDYKAKAEEELANIQRKARQLEHMMLQYQAVHSSPKDSPMSPIHDSFHTRGRELASSPVDNGTSSHQSARLRSVSDVTGRFTEGSRSSSRQGNFRPQPHPRRTKSSGAIEDDARYRTRDGVIPNPDIPYQCVYCKRTFETFATAQQLHSKCPMWSCSFLPGIQYAIYPVEADGELKALCCYCNDSLGSGKGGRVKSAVLKGHMRQHKFRGCNHKLYYSGQCFRQHLHDEHRTIYDGSLFAAWTLLFKSCQRSQPAFFERAETIAGARRVNTDPGLGGKKSGTNKAQAVPSNFMELTETSITEPNKLRRKRSAATLPEKGNQEVYGSTLSLPRPATTDATGSTIPPLPQEDLSRYSPVIGAAVENKTPTFDPWLVGNIAGARLGFYRRKIDASTRNQVYLHSLDESLSGEYQKHFRKIRGGIVGGLILHSSLVACVPVRLTGSVDVYPLH